MVELKVKENQSVAIVVVNWNGWRHTLEFLESVFQSDYPTYRIFICDNDSQDGSVERIQDWARGAQASESENPEMLEYSAPPIPKPVDLLIVDEQGNRSGAEDAPIVIIKSRHNRGFAGGNNLAIEFAKQSGTYDYFWLLNNDVVIARNALRLLVERMAEADNRGIAGTQIRFYWAPDKLQARGGSTFSRWTCNSTCLGSLEPATVQMDRNIVEAQMDFIVGASLCVSADFLKEIGLMEESYFLYFEEADWAARNKGKFPMLYAERSVVFHKEGGAIGSSSEKGARSEISEFYLARGKVMFTIRHYPYALPTVCATLIAQILRRIWRRQFDKAWIIFSVLCGRRQY